VAFNFSTNKIATKKLIKKMETKVSGRLVVNEGGVEKALEGVGSVSTLNAEMMGDNLQIVGTFHCNVFYLSGERALSTGVVQLELNEKCKLGEVEAITVIPRIKDTKLVKESSEQILVTAVVELKIYGVVSTEICVVEGEEEGCYTCSKSTKINQLVASANTSFTLTSPLDIVDEPSKVLMVESTSSIARVSAQENYVEVEGTVNLDVWMSEGEQIKKVQKSIDFTEEVPMLNCNPDLLLDYMVFDKAVNLVLEENAVADITISISLLGFSSREVNLIQDAFSDSKLLDLTISSFDNVIYEPTRVFSERKNLIADTSEKKRIDEIVFVGGSVAEVLAIESKDDVIEVSGNVRVPVIYKNYDNDEVLSSNLISPFDIKLSTESKEGEREQNICVEVSSRVNAYKNKAGKEVSLVVDFEGTISCESVLSEQLVSKIEKSEERAKKRSSIIVYKPKKDESLFNIAKTLRVSPDVLRLQNPQLEEGTTVGQVVVYTKF